MLHLCCFSTVLGFSFPIQLRLATLLKKKLWHRCFPVNFATFSRTPTFKEHLRWLLLTKLSFQTIAHGFLTTATINHIPGSIYLLKVNNENIRTRCEICSMLTIIVIVKFERISHLVLMFPLLTLNM